MLYRATHCQSLFINVYSYTFIHLSFFLHNLFITIIKLLKFATWMRLILKVFRQSIMTRPKYHKLSFSSLIVMDHIIIMLCLNIILVVILSSYKKIFIIMILKWSSIYGLCYLAVLSTI